MHLQRFVFVTLNHAQRLGQWHLENDDLFIGQLFFGMTSDQYGRRRPLLLGVAGFVLASIACALAPTMWVFLAARALQGFCGSSGVVIGRACYGRNTQLTGCLFTRGGSICNQEVTYDC